MRYQQPFGVSNVDAQYLNGDPSIGRAGSIPPAAAFEHPMRELVNVITSTGLSPNETDLEQLWKAIQIAPWVQEYAQDTSPTPNSIIAAIDPVPPSLVLGTVVRIRLANTNTGLVTLSLNSFGTHNVKKANGSVLAAGDLTVGQIATLIWTGSEWQVINYLGTSAPVSSNNFNIDIPYAADTGTTANHIVANFSPDISAAAAGDVILVKALRTNTGATDIACDAQAIKAIIRPNGTPLEAGDIVAGQMMILLFDGTGWQLCNPIFWFSDTGTGSGTGNFVPGAIYLWPTELAPDGTLECSGQAVSRTQYSRLYGIIGTMYGSGNGTTTFNVPDYRGRFIRGWDHGANQDPERTTRQNRGDGTTGDHVGTKQLDEFRSHRHAPESGGYFKVDRVSYEAQDGGDHVQDAVAYFTAYTGGAETRPVNVSAMFIIAI